MEVGWSGGMAVAKQGAKGSLLLSIRILKLGELPGQEHVLICILPMDVANTRGGMEVGWSGGMEVAHEEGIKGSLPFLDLKDEAERAAWSGICTDMYTTDGCCKL